MKITYDRWGGVAFETEDGRDQLFLEEMIENAADGKAPGDLDNFMGIWLSKGDPDYKKVCMGPHEFLNCGSRDIGRVSLNFYEL